jgi:CRISPR-associated Csx2 family protein
MPRKILISFLGTNNYVPANYYLGDQSHKVDNVRFIQEAILELICIDWTENDVVKVFLTDEAEKNNWVDNGHLDRDKKVIECEGLKSRLESFAAHHKSKVNFEPILNVPTGITETDVWDVFDAIYEQLEEKDEVYFDITHSFRSIPMLCMVLLNYAKYLKNITVKGIYYGAFEVLGPAWYVKNNMPVEDRNAPIVDVTRFSMLQDWSIAAGDFATYGNADRLQQNSSEVLKPFLIKAKGEDKSLLALNRTIKNTKKFTENIQTCRGKLIIENGAAKQIIEDLSNVTEDAIAIRPIVPLLSAIKSALSDFGNGPGVQNGYAAAKWCLKNNLIQQGLTILEETIISEVCEEMKIPLYVEKDRMLVSSCFNILHDKINESDWKGEAARNKDLTNRILNKSSVLKEKCASFLTISGIRNDINHAGMRNNDSSYKKFKSILKDNVYFTATKNVLRNNELFINLSNHPSTNWDEYQLECAGEYGEIIDFVFPAVDPNASSYEIEELAENLIQELDRLAELRDSSIKAIHIMGEHTLSYTLVSKLQKRNITCLASTTERMVTQNGDEKVSVFKFISFRTYPELL